MSIEKFLSNEAADIAARLDEFAQKRVLSYRPRIGPDLQCPRCWVETEIRSTLGGVARPLGTPSTSSDILTCHTCDAHFCKPSDNPI